MRVCNRELPLAIRLGREALSFDPHGYRAQWLDLLTRLTDSPQE